MIQEAFTTIDLNQEPSTIIYFPPRDLESTLLGDERLEKLNQFQIDTANLKSSVDFNAMAVAVDMTIKFTRDLTEKTPVNLEAQKEILETIFEFSKMEMERIANDLVEFGQIHYTFDKLQNHVKEKITHGISRDPQAFIEATKQSKEGQYIAGGWGQDINSYTKTTTSVIVGGAEFTPSYHVDMVRNDFEPESYRQTEDRPATLSPNAGLIIASTTTIDHTSNFPADIHNESLTLTALLPDGGRVN